MKYCIPFIKGSKLNAKVEEISIEYRYMTDLVTLIDFLKEFPKQRIIINIELAQLHTLTEEDYKNFCVIKDQFNIVIRFPYDKQVAEECLKRAIPFYFSTGCQDWDAVHSFIGMGVTDILIVNELGFSLKQISELTKEKGVKIRVFPNVAQASYNGTAAITRFFIRPEDIEKYEPYVDVCEFFGKLEHIEFFYDIYIQNQQWKSVLGLAISNFEDIIHNSFISNKFADRRISCEKKCIKGGRCQSCKNIKDVADLLLQQKIKLQTKKKI